MTINHKLSRFVYECARVLIYLGVEKTSFAIAIIPSPFNPRLPHHFVPTVWQYTYVYYSIAHCDVCVRWWRERENRRYSLIREVEVWRALGDELHYQYAETQAARQADTHRPGWEPDMRFKSAPLKRRLTATGRQRNEINDSRQRL